MGRRIGSPGMEFGGATTVIAIEEDAEWLAGDRAFGYRHDGLHGASSRRAHD